MSVDPEEIGACPRVDGREVRAAVAEDGRHDEGRYARHHPLRALGAGQGATRITLIKKCIDVVGLKNIIFALLNL